VVPLATRAPFNLEATVRVLQRRPSNAIDVWEHGSYLRVLNLPAGPVLAEVENRGTIDNPDLHLTIRAGDDSARTGAEARATVHRILGLDMDPAPLQRSVEAEQVIRATCRALRGMRPPRFANLFESFASVVPFQQLSLDAGVAILARLGTRLGSPLQHAGRCFHAFPTARQFAAARLDVLRSCGLSRQKARTLIGLARAIEAGDLGEDEFAGMSTSSAMARFKELPGIGPWSAGLVLLRGLGRLDMFPPGDVGAARSLRALMRLGPSSPLEPVIERFGRHRGYLYFCALGASLLAKGLIHPAAGKPRDLSDK
jgi:DNA-3-methyladenine glycosylase II